jgi:hypothetical protein
MWKVKSFHSPDEKRKASACVSTNHSNQNCPSSYAGIGGALARSQLTLYALNQYCKFLRFMFALGVLAEFANVLGLFRLSESDAVHRGDLFSEP